MGRFRDWLNAADVELEVRHNWPYSELQNTVVQSDLLATWPRSSLSATDLALQVPTAVRCIEILTTQIAQFEVHAWRGDTQLDTPRLFRRPDPFSDLYTFVKDSVFDMLAEGTAAWEVTARTPEGFASSLRHLPACDLEVRWDPALPVPQARRMKARQIKYGGQLVDPADVVLIPMILAPGAAKGLGPVQAGQPISYGQVMADGLVRSNFDEASYPSGVLETPGNLSEDRARDLSDKFVERMRGSRRPAVLSGGVTYQALTHNARDQQWIEARQWGAAEIARLFGLPPAALHIPVVGGSQVTYNNAVSVRTDILHLGLTPIISRLESAWSSLLPSTQQAHIDTTNYLPPLEAITPSAADPNAPPTDTANTPTPDQEADPDAGNTAVV